MTGGLASDEQGGPPCDRGGKSLGGGTQGPAARAGRDTAGGGPGEAPGRRVEAGGAEEPAALPDFPGSFQILWVPLLFQAPVAWRDSRPAGT